MLLIRNMNIKSATGGKMQFVMQDIQRRTRGSWMQSGSIDPHSGAKCFLFAVCVVVGNSNYQTFELSLN